MDDKGRYTAKDLCEKFFRDFSIDELYTFDKRGIASVHEMTSGDKIIIEDETLDYLKDFFNGIYDGDPIPQIFDKVLIEWNTIDNMPVHIYVVFPEDKPDWVYLDVYLGWRYAGRILMPNVPISDSERVESGKFKFYSPFYSAKAYHGNPNSVEMENRLTTTVRDIFMYVFLYIAANRGNPQLYKEEVVIDKSQKYKSRMRNQVSTLTRSKEFIPKQKRRVYSLTRKTTTDYMTEKMCQYVFLRWHVRGYSYTKKDGRVINVMEHLSYHNKPNQGIKMILQ